LRENPGGSWTPGTETVFRLGGGFSPASAMSIKGVRSSSVVCCSSTSADGLPPVGAHARPWSWRLAAHHCTRAILFYLTCRRDRRMEHEDPAPSSSLLHERRRKHAGIFAWTPFSFSLNTMSWFVGLRRLRRVLPSGGPTGLGVRGRWAGFAKMRVTPAGIGLPEDRVQGPPRPTLRRGLERFREVAP